MHKTAEETKQYIAKFITAARAILKEEETLPLEQKMSPIAQSLARDLENMLTTIGVLQWLDKNGKLKDKLDRHECRLVSNLGLIRSLIDCANTHVESLDTMRKILQKTEPATNDAKTLKEAYATLRVGLHTNLKCIERTVDSPVPENKESGPAITSALGLHAEKAKQNAEPQAAPAPNTDANEEKEEVATNSLKN